MKRNVLGIPNDLIHIVVRRESTRSGKAELYRLDNPSQGLTKNMLSIKQVVDPHNTPATVLCKFIICNNSLICQQSLEETTLILLFYLVVDEEIHYPLLKSPFPLQ